jgi:hypothetical protein
MRVARGMKVSLTLGLQEHALLNTVGNSTVDVALVSSVGEVANAVVGLDVLLNSLTARIIVSASSRTMRPKHDVTCETSTFKGETHLDPLRSLSCRVGKAR